MLLFESTAPSNDGRISCSPIVPDRLFSAVSLNIAKETNSDNVVNAIRAVPRLRDADLYLFQEVTNRERQTNVADEASRKLGHSVSFVASAPGIYDQGLAIVSRYPITDVQVMQLKACDLRFRCRSRLALAGTVRTPWGDVRAWNVYVDELSGRD